MKGVIPAAGQGTRLYPQTHTKPKPMVRLAGKPILGHILDNFVRSPVNDVIVVVGVMQELVAEYVSERYGHVLDLTFVEQSQTEGLGHSVYQARSVVGDDPMCIALGDMLFDSDYADFIEAHRALGSVDGSLGVKQVDTPSSYGIVTLDGDEITNLEEKPDAPDSDLAISGVYFIEDSESLFEAIEYLIENDLRGAGDEYQLTDALQRMLDQGATFGTFDVGKWYDCGQPDTLLTANRVLLERIATTNGGIAINGDSSMIIQPADIGENVTLKRSVVGPYVSIDDGVDVIQSHVSDSIISRNATVKRANLQNSIVGDQARVTGTPNELNVGDSSDVQL
ncbi:sugar phosphate nucleotidyltransferase [Halorussus salinisoli]|uniref:sugar phosphate nucleotidyltransferase n=1 Tax=Halorussus salinisoli TaxID=2558242 RepID=UPI0010C1B974|nr:sugar phosphate nucleotidyltransferase [Halorussus salinisoli]